MLIRALSDQHGYLPAIEPCDLLLIAGDVCPVHDHSLGFQVRWLRGPFRDWLWSLEARYVVGVAGNHDFVFLHPELVPDLPWTYLRDSEVQLGGLRIYGSPWTPTLGGWAFEASQQEQDRVFSLIPAGVDVLVSHGPPYSIGDALPRHDWRGWQRDEPEHVGSRALLQAVDRVEPGLHVFGHIHEARGQWRRGRTRLANVTLLDERYALRYEPQEFELRSR